MRWLMNQNESILPERLTSLTPELIRLSVWRVLRSRLTLTLQPDLLGWRRRWFNWVAVSLFWWRSTRCGDVNCLAEVGERLCRPLMAGRRDCNYGDVDDDTSKMSLITSCSVISVTIVVNRQERQLPYERDYCTTARLNGFIHGAAFGGWRENSHAANCTWEFWDSAIVHDDTLGRK